MLRKAKTYFIAFLVLAKLIIVALPYLFIFVRLELRRYFMKRMFRRTLKKTGISQKAIVEMERMYLEKVSVISDFRKLLSIKH
ncbi:MAG: hypothetical protein B6U76_10770 [Desulfurococcales archaeon ex4484_217_2]|nr:MAG: hypothetical protein B6U76_10770 [Desulfurococcales archaeon ex4484_217_2]